jgi:hypothetical protein
VLFQGVGQFCTAAMSIMSYNGTALVAMTGKNCVGIASDRRFGVQAQTLSTDSKKIFPMHDKVMVGLSGLNTDVHTFSSLLKYRVNMYTPAAHTPYIPYSRFALGRTLTLRPLGTTFVKSATSLRRLALSSFPQCCTASDLVPIFANPSLPA